MLNNRDCVVIGILIVFIFFLLYKKETRIPLQNILKQFIDWKLLLPILCMIFYIGLLIWILFSLDLWNLSFLKDTIIWTGAAFIMLFNYSEVSKDFKKYIQDNIKLTILLEFIIGLYVFNIFGELLLIPTIIIVTLINVVAKTKKKYKQVEQITNIVIGTIGIYILFYAINQCISDLQNFATLNNLKLFLLPIILTILFIPFVYLFALIAAYESLFVRLDKSWFRNNKKLSMYTKKKVLTKCLWNLKMVKSLSKNRAMDFINSKNKSDINKIFR